MEDQDEKEPEQKSRKKLYFTTDASRTFTKLKQAFVKALILNHFNPEHHIWIEIDVFGYTIGRILSQLTLDDLGPWHLVAFFSKKMILAETWYKTYNGKLLAIIEALKTWKHYLKGCKHEVLVLTNHNNFQRFIDLKSLSSRKVR